MRVLILSHAQYVTVGLPKIIEFAESLVGLGHKVILCVTSRVKRWGIVRHVKNSVQIVECPSLLVGGLRHGVDPFDVLNRIWVLRKEKFDIVHCVASRPTVFYPGIFLRKMSRATTLIYEWEDSFTEGGVALEMRGVLYYRLFGWIEKYYEEKLARLADGLIVVSDFLKQRSHKLGVNEEKILKQIKGVKELALNLPDKESAKRKLLGNNDHGFVFTYVGSIYDSDLSLMFSAFQKAAKNHPEIRLRLIGYNRKRPKKIPANVKILPRIPDDEYAMNLVATDVFLLPLRCSTANISRYPSKFGDYLSVGRPVVATPLPEVKEIVREGRCGYISESDSVESFSGALLKALEDRVNWTLLGNNGRKYAKKYLSWEHIIPKVVAFYEEIQRAEKSVGN